MPWIYVYATYPITLGAGRRMCGFNNRWVTGQPAAERPAFVVLSLIHI